MKNAGTEAPFMLDRIILNVLISVLISIVFVHNASAQDEDDGSWTTTPWGTVHLTTFVDPGTVYPKTSPTAYAEQFAKYESSHNTMAAYQASSGDGDNHFKTVSPHGDVQDNVNLFTGQFSTSIPIATLSTSAISFPIGLSYSSGPEVSLWSEFGAVNSATVGMDWSMSMPFIQRETMGTAAMADDVFWCQLGPWGGGVLVRGPTTATAYQLSHTFYLASNPKIKIIADVVPGNRSNDYMKYPVAQNEIAGFRVFLPEGIELRFGAENAADADRSAVRFQRISGSRVGATDLAAPRIGYRWDIREITDVHESGKIDFFWKRKWWPDDMDTTKAYIASSRIDAVVSLATVSSVAAGSGTHKVNGVKFNWSTETYPSWNSRVPEDLSQRPVNDPGRITSIDFSDFSDDASFGRKTTTEFTYQGLNKSGHPPSLTSLNATTTVNGQTAKKVDKWSFGYTAESPVRLSSIVNPENVTENITWKPIDAGKYQANSSVVLPKFSVGDAKVNPDEVKLESWCDDEACFLAEKGYRNLYPEFAYVLKLHAWKVKGTYTDYSKELDGFPLNYTLKSGEVLTDKLHGYKILHGNDWFAVADEVGGSLEMFSRSGTTYSPKTMPPSWNNQIGDLFVKDVPGSPITQDIFALWDVSQGTDYLIIKRYKASERCISHDATGRTCYSSNFVPDNSSDSYAQLGVLNKKANDEWEFILEGANPASDCPINNVKSKNSNENPRNTEASFQKFCLDFDNDVNVVAGPDYFMAIHYNRGIVFTYAKDITGQFHSITESFPVILSGNQETGYPANFNGVTPTWAQAGVRNIALGLNEMKGSGYWEALLQYDGVSLSLNDVKAEMGNSNIRFTPGFMTVTDGDCSPSNANKDISYTRITPVNYQYKEKGKWNLKLFDVLSSFTGWEYHGDYGSVAHVSSYQKVNCKDNPLVGLSRDKFGLDIMYGPLYSVGTFNRTPPTSVSDYYGRGVVAYPQGDIDRRVNSAFWMDGTLQAPQFIHGTYPFGADPMTTMITSEPSAHGIIAWKFPKISPLEETKPGRSDIIPGYFQKTDAKATWLDYLAADFTNLQPWNVTFTEAGDKALLARYDYVSQTSKVWFSKNINGSLYKEIKPTPTIVVQQTVVSYPVDQNLPDRIERFNYGTSDVIVGDNAGMALFDSKMQQMNTPSARVRKTQVSNGIEYPVSTSTFKFIVDSPFSPIDGDEQNKVGYPTNVYTQDDVTGASSETTTEYKWLSLPGLPVYTGNVVATKSTSKTTDAFGSTQSSITSFSNYTDFLTPQVATTVLNGSGATYITQTKLTSFPVGQPADQNRPWAWEAPTEKYSFKLSTPLPTSDVDKIPYASQDASGLKIIGATASSWRDSYPGEKTSESIWDPRPSQSELNADNVNAPSVFHYSLADGWKKTKEFTDYDAYGHAQTSLDNMAEKDASASATIFGGIRYLPMAVFTGATRMEIGVLTGESELDLNGVTVGFARSGNSVYKVDANKTGYFDQHIGTGKPTRLDAYVYSKSATAPQIDFNLVLGEAVEMTVQASPTKGYTPSKWTRYEAVLQLPRPYGAVMRMKVKAMGSDVYVDDVVMAPVGAHWVLFGYNNMGQKVSSVSDGSDPIYYRYDRFGRSTLSTDQYGRSYRQEAINGQGENVTK